MGMSDGTERERRARPWAESGRGRRVGSPSYLLVRYEPAEHYSKTLYRIVLYCIINNKLMSMFRIMPSVLITELEPLRLK